MAEGFVHGAAAFYAERVSITQAQCMLLGADACVFHCVFAAAEKIVRAEGVPL